MEGGLGGVEGGLGGVGWGWVGLDSRRCKVKQCETHERVDLFVLFCWGETCFFLNEPQKRRFMKVELVLGDCSFVHLS